MRKTRVTSMPMFFIFLCLLSSAVAQQLAETFQPSDDLLQPFGLQDKRIKALASEAQDRTFGLKPSTKLFAGTFNEGVFENSPFGGSGDWISLGLEKKNISCLSVQRWGVGPADGLTLYAGILPLGSIDTVNMALLYKRELIIARDSTWVPADTGIDRKTTEWIEAINSYYFTGHTPPQPLISGGSTGIYQGHGNVIWSKAFAAENLWIHAIDVTPHWFGALAWAAGTPASFPAPVALKSTDQGKNWSVHYLPYAMSDDALSVAIDPRSPDTVYIGYSNGLVLMTTDGGGNWRSTSLQQPLVRLTALAVHPLAPEHVFVGGVRANNGFAFYHSKDGGATWTEISPPSGQQPAGVSSIVVMDTGTARRQSFVFIGTFGTGVWRYDPSLITDVHDKPGIPNGFMLRQNYPNPFNPLTTISYDLLARSYVTLKIFNVLRQAVATLVDGEVQAGRHQVQWNAGRLASGVYFYRLQAGRLVENRKMILLK